jgi:hypothetical protein
MAHQVVLDMPALREHSRLTSGYLGVVIVPIAVFRYRVQFFQEPRPVHIV